MNAFFEKALKNFHEIADQDRDGKITRQDAAIVLGQLQKEAGDATVKATPLGALFIAFVAGGAVGAIAHVIWSAL